jgi:hypothetical protein
MKFEYLIWVIIFLVYVVSVIIKKVRAASKTSEKGVAKRLPMWKERLNKFMSQVKKEIETAKQEDLEKETGWERFLPREDDEPELAMADVTLEDLEPIRKETHPERVVRVLKKTPSPKIKPAPVKVVAESIEPTVSGKEILTKDLEFGIQDLRKAIIWSEILAPPLALRDE